MTSSAAQASGAPATRRRSRLRLTRAGAIWIYVAGLFGLATAAFLAFVHGIAPLVHPHLPWWALAIGFLLGELCVVHLQFRRSAHSFSLADIPFVFGLVFAGGNAFVAGALLGAGG